MENKIRKILDDLYMIDEDLKNSEKELEAIVRKLLESRPEVEINKQFIDELKVELLERADEIKQKSAKQSALFNISIKNFSFMLTGAAICAILFILTDYIPKDSLNSEKNVADNMISKIEKLEDGAFGSFSKNNEVVTDEQFGSRSEVVSDSAVASVAMLEPTVGVGAGGGRAINETMMVSPKIMPPMTTYNYVYNGEKIKLPSGKLSVYKREKSAELSKALANKISSVDFSLVDTGKIKNTTVQNINITEDREFGYNFYFDFVSNMLSVNSNWERWPNIYDICGENDQDCYEYNKLQISDIPNDTTLISLADKFLVDYGISKSEFDKPIIDKKWLEQETFGRGDEKYIPERIDITYPLKVEGKSVYSEYGTFEGMVISIDIRFGKVASAMNIFEQKYSSSDYAVSSNMEKILKVLKRGGNNNFYGSDGARKIDVEVGSPDLALVKMWKQEFQEDKQVELYVPCLVFPIIGETEDGYTNRENIVVPIIEELINSYEDVDGEDFEIMPMPLIRAE